MFTPSIIRLRKELRDYITLKYYNKKAEEIFNLLKNEKAPVITFKTISTFCLEKEIPFENIENIFLPYGINNPYISLEQWIQFFNDDFSNFNNIYHFETLITERQKFILSKFINILRTKFGGKLSDRWKSSLQRNPPNSKNTKLYISSLCKLFNDMNLPFSTEDFIDSLFSFFGNKFETININQFDNLFKAFT